MKKLIANKIIFAVALSNIFMLLGIMILLNYYNEENAKMNISNLIGIFENQIKNDNIRSPLEYRKIVNLDNMDDSIRVSIIKLDGEVIADTFTRGIEKTPLENHKNREEVAMSVKENGIHYAMRISSTHNLYFMYGAKKIYTPMGNIILRVAIPFDSINRYFTGFLIISMVVILLIILLILYMMPFITKEIIKPFGIIKNNLHNILEGDYSIRRDLTKFDEINVVFEEINTVAVNIRNMIRDNTDEREKLNYVLENINQGLIAVGKESDIVFINSPALSFFNYTNGKPYLLIEIMRDENIIRKIENAVKNKELAAFDIYLENISRSLEVNVVPIFNNNRITSLIKLSDVSDTRKLAKEKYDLFINASHKLSTPLTSILGYSELIIQNGIEANDNFVKRIYEEAGKMKLLISDMLKLSRYEDKASEDINENIDMKKLIENVSEGYQLRLREKTINIAANLEENIFIFANKEKISEVISNLLDNSIKYTRHYGAIEILLYKENKKAVFVIKDNGIGIPKKYIHRVFERFFRVEEGIAKTVGGTGLGLAIVKHICSSYNAEISIKSKEHVSTEITIKFDAL